MSRDGGLRHELTVENSLRRVIRADTCCASGSALLGLMAEGRSNSGLAEQLSLNIKTVESHFRNIFTKLDLDIELDDHRRVRAVLLYLSYATS
jgi:DNA-binding NarL/FixJ family response regulator